MTKLNGLIEKKDAQGRVIERGMYRDGHRVGDFRITDFDKGFIIEAQYSDNGDEKILRSCVYAMVWDRIGDCVHKGDKLQTYTANPNGTVTIESYTYMAGCRKPMIKTDVLKTSVLNQKKSRSGR